MEYGYFFTIVYKKFTSCLHCLQAINLCYVIIIFLVSSNYKFILLNMHFFAIFVSCQEVIQLKLNIHFVGVVLSYFFSYWNAITFFCHCLWRSTSHLTSSVNLCYISICFDITIYGTFLLVHPHEKLLGLLA